MYRPHIPTIEIKMKCHHASISILYYMFQLKFYKLKMYAIVQSTPVQSIIHPNEMKLENNLNVSHDAQ